MKLEQISQLENRNNGDVSNHPWIAYTCIPQGSQDLDKEAFDQEAERAKMGPPTQCSLYKIVSCLSHVPLPQASITGAGTKREANGENIPYATHNLSLCLQISWAEI